MSGYPPTTDEVRATYIGEPKHWLDEQIGAEFDRWLAAHDAVKRAEWEAEQGETEWEYGATNAFDDKPVSIRDTLAEAVEAQAFYTRERGRKTNLMMRAKAVPAGPWLPVPGSTVRESDSGVRDPDSEEGEGKA